MDLLAARDGARHSWRVPEASPELSDRQVWGAALRALRLRIGKTLQEAADAYEPPGYTPGDPNKGVSVQRWQQIEKGQLKFSADQRQRLARALEADLEELELERARILGHRPRVVARGMAEPEERSFTIPIFGHVQLDRDGWKVKDATAAEGFFDLRELVGPSIGVTHVADDTMSGRAEPGALVIFDRGRRPKPGKGCVVETEAGELYPRLFQGIDAEHVLVAGTSGHKTAFRRDQVKGVYAVRFWGD